MRTFVLAVLLLFIASPTEREEVVVAPAARTAHASANGSTGTTAEQLGIDTADANARVRSDTATSLTIDQRALLDWALGRFHIAGLAAPTSSVDFATDTSACDGYRGLFDSRSNHITICVDDDAALDARRSVIVHELAHAWSVEHLSSAERSAFVDRRAASSWNDHDDDWASRGIEHAAEIITWGLTDVTVSLHGITGTKDPTTLHATFVWLTGVDPNNDGTPAAGLSTEGVTSDGVNRS
jgi:hypothetical protein